MREERIRLSVYVPGEPAPARALGLVAAAESTLAVPFDHILERAGLRYSDAARSWFQRSIAAGNESPMLMSQDGRASLIWRSHPKQSNPGGVEMSEIVVEAPFEPPFIERAGACLSALGVISQAYLGEAFPSRASRHMYDLVIRKSPRPPPPAPFGLPRVKGWSSLPSPIYPVLIGWLNYWPPATCALLRFPDPTRDTDLLTRSRQLPNGAWLVQLTEDPLDPAARPDHVRALAEAYARFPAIGGREEVGVPLRG